MNTAMMVLVWSALGFKLTFPRGQLSTVVAWIGGTITAEADGVRAVIKESIVTHILDDVRRLSGQNIITKKEVHSLLGKMNHAAGRLIVIRPFLEPMWAALTAPDPKGAPPNSIWTKQIVSSLQWPNPFFAGRVHT